MSTILTKETNSSTKKQDDLFSAGDWLYWTCEYEKAQAHFRAVLKVSSLTPSDLVRCYKSLSAVEVELKNYNEAIDIYKKQLQILREMRDSTKKNEDIMSCYISIGKVYWLKTDYKQAIDYNNQALEYTESPNQVSSIYKNLANIYTNTKQFDLALDYFQKALLIDLEQQPKNNLQFAQTYTNMAVMYQSKDDYKGALNYFVKTRETLLKTIPATHMAIKKIDKTISKMESKINTQSVNSWDILAQNNIMILWLDDYIGQDGNCKELKNNIRQITNSFKMVDSVESCRECLPHLKDRKLFCIIQGKYAKEIVPDIVQTISPSMTPIVYIFCLNTIYLVQWAQDHECIMEGGIFDHENVLFSKLDKDLSNYIQQKSQEYKSKLAVELDGYLKKLMLLLEGLPM